MTDLTDELDFIEEIPPRTREVTEPSKYDVLLDKAIAVKDNTESVLVVHKGTVPAASSFAYRLRLKAEQRSEKFEIVQTKDNIHVRYITGADE